MDVDWSGFLFKRRGNSDFLRNLSTAGWQKRYFVLRKKDCTFSWYLNVTDKQPCDVVDLNEHFSCDVFPLEEEKHFLLCLLSLNGLSLVMRTSSEEDCGRWIEEIGWRRTTLG